MLNQSGEEQDPNVVPTHVPRTTYPGSQSTSSPVNQIADTPPIVEIKLEIGQLPLEESHPTNSSTLAPTTSDVHSNQLFGIGSYSEELPLVPDDTPVVITSLSVKCDQVYPIPIVKELAYGDVPETSTETYDIVTPAVSIPVPSTLALITRYADDAGNGASNSLENYALVTREVKNGTVKNTALNDPCLGGGDGVQVVGEGSKSTKKHKCK